jgi:hypothetical protein
MRNGIIKYVNRWELIKEISLIISRGSIKFCSVLNSLLNSLRVGFGFMVFNATFNNISAISWRFIGLVEETGVPGENHRPVTSHR